MLPPLVAPRATVYPADMLDPMVLGRMLAHGLRDRGNISPRSRELMILRTCARCRAQFEWCARIASFNDKSRWTLAQVRSIVQGGADDFCWEGEDRLVMRVADQLHEACGVDGALWKELGAHFEPDQVVELFALAGLYQELSRMVGVAASRHQDAKTIEQPIPT